MLLWFKVITKLQVVSGFRTICTSFSARNYITFT